MDEDLPIQALAVNGQIAGAYRGKKFQRLPDGTAGGGEVLGRVLIDTDRGPVAICGDASVLTKLRALEVSDGDQITITRQAEDVYRVVRHG